MKLTPIQKRAERKARNHQGLDMNLVALIDIFTILIFFLMSSTGIEVLSTARAVKLPESTAEKMPRETVVISVSATEIVVGGRKVATAGEARLFTVSLALPAYTGRTATRAPSFHSTEVQSARTAECKRAATRGARSFPRAEAAKRTALAFTFACAATTACA